MSSVYSADVSLSGNQTIKDAVNNVSSGNKVDIYLNGYNESNIYYGSENSNIQISGNFNITIIGNHSDGTILRGNGSDRAFHLWGNNVNLKFINITFENFAISDYEGGAIYNGGSDLTLINCTFINCSSNIKGGAIYNKGILNIYDSTFKDNYAMVDGGAIYNEYGYLKVNNSTFVNNTLADYISSIHIFSGSAIFDNCTFNKDGRIYAETAQLTVLNSIFNNDNKVCIINLGSNLKVTSNSFFNTNTGINNKGRNALIANNKFFNVSDAIYNDASEAIIEKNIINGNSLSFICAIFNSGARTIIRNNNITGFEYGIDNRGYNSLISYNFISNSEKGIINLGGEVKIIYNIIQNVSIGINNRVGDSALISINYNSIDKFKNYGIEIESGNIELIANTIKNGFVKSTQFPETGTAIIILTGFDSLVINIKNNNLLNNSYGVVIPPIIDNTKYYYSITISNNNINNNKYGIWNLGKTEYSDILISIDPIYKEYIPKLNFYYINVNIIANIFKGNDIGIRNSGLANISSNSISSNKGDGVFLYAGAISKVYNNVINSNKGAGIRNNAVGSNIYNNKINDNSYGIYNNAKATLSGNTLSKNTNYGIYNNGLSSSITNNVISSSKVGIYNLIKSTLSSNKVTGLSKKSSVGIKLHKNAASSSINLNTVINCNNALYNDAKSVVIQKNKLSNSNVAIYNNGLSSSIKSNTISKSATGIYNLIKSSITSNKVTGLSKKSSIGIKNHKKGASTSILRNSIDNTKYGIHNSAKKVKIQKNTIKKSSNGVYTKFKGAIVKNNRFI
ncbi:MAG: right-handed parallel beta-helix repeat-containing protein [Methanobacteriaceae archaeon]